MTLNQALARIRQQPAGDSRRIIYLACGFEPLHLTTLLKAGLIERFPAQTPEVQTGRYGDLEGSLAAAARSDAEAAGVVIEWSDIDSRLGLRSSGGWGPSLAVSITENCRERWGRILSKVTELAAKMPVALTAPSLATPLFGHTPGWQLDAVEAELQLDAAGFLAQAARLNNVRVANPVRTARLSPEAARLDATMELTAGFPYTIGHASAVASQLLTLLFPATPMKGLITDLDDTLWSGIVGEVGAAGVSWSLADHAQLHGLYQQQLRQLAEIGVLLGIVSKNETAVVEEALQRAGLYVSKDAFYPIRASWKPKSQAVGEILSVWNVGPESVVFIDDSPMEIAEVGKAFPAMTCLQFPARNPGQALALFEQLRDLFGKAEIRGEDQLRQASIRGNAQFREAASQSSGGDFIRSLEGEVTFHCGKDTHSKRLLELINKTNQFNLNGARITEGEWLRLLEDESSLIIGISYEDKFGPLGTIGAVVGRQSENCVEITSWVLSCRAFSRNIEHHILDYLFHERGGRAIRFAFRPTERNQPLREFLGSMGLDCNGGGEIELSPGEFRVGSNDLPHRTC